jgi:DNA-binding response OmpR family regulator
MVHELGAHAAAHRSEIELDGVSMRLDGADAVLDRRVVPLGRRERAVLDCLARRPGAVVAKSVLRDEVWGDGASLHVVEVTVARLRERLVGHLDIVALPRRGYRLAASTPRPRGGERTRTAAPPACAQLDVTR